MISKKIELSFEKSDKDLAIRFCHLLDMTWQICPTSYIFFLMKNTKATSSQIFLVNGPRNRSIFVFIESLVDRV